MGLARRRLHRRDDAVEVVAGPLQFGEPAPGLLPPLPGLIEVPSRLGQDPGETLGLAGQGAGSGREAPAAAAGRPGLVGPRRP
ncbi:MAG: hypothetical protein PGN34_12620 [Methylobacterium frigidaeris]